MGRRKKANVRGQLLAGMDERTLIAAIDKGIQLGIIQLPKSVSLYRRCIWEAMEGNFEMIDQAIIRLSNMYHGTQIKDNEPIQLKRWKAGMKGSYEGCYYVLTMYRQLLGVYHAARPTIVDKVSSKFSGSRRRKGNSVVC